MRNWIVGGLIGVAGVFPTATATANDTLASLTVGGLELLSTEEIAMVSEDLQINLGEVRVRYEFRNLSDRDVEATVAFPLPAIEMSEAYGMSLAGIESETYDFVGFRLWIDGAPAEPELLVRATLGGRDVRYLLDRYAIPYSTYHPAFADRWAGLSPEALAVLAQEGLVDPGGTSPRPLWVFEAAYHWQQRFAAGATVKVEHVYTPIVGGAFARYSAADATEELRFIRQGYGVDGAAEAVIRGRLNEMPKDAEGSGIAWLWYTDYVLTTANSWAGPIGRFRLTIDAGDAGNVVALCEDGMPRHGSPPFVVERENYQPTDELHILVMAFPGTPADRFPPRLPP